MTSQNIIEFWFEDIDTDLWFAKNKEFDQTIRSLFYEVYEKVLLVKLPSGAKNPKADWPRFLFLISFRETCFVEWQGPSKATLSL
jgi:uncharacterized protein (DUF924 family)